MARRAACLLYVAVLSRVGLRRVECELVEVFVDGDDRAMVNWFALAEKAQLILRVDT